MLNLVSTLRDRTCIYHAYTPSSFQSYKKVRKKSVKENDKKTLNAAVNMNSAILWGLDKPIVILKCQQKRS